MSRVPSWRAALGAGLLAVSLTGCISLLPKEKPSRLYRFGFTAADTPATPAATRFTVRAAPIGFDRAAASDRILTVDKDQVAYIAGARWVTPAADLFQSAVVRAFATTGDQARLVAAGEPIATDYVLKLDVRSFEARYEHGAAAAPTVRIELYAALIGRKDPGAGTSRLFVASAPASSNSVHAIALAFDSALGTVLTDLTNWVSAKGAAA